MSSCLNTDNDTMFLTVVKDGEERILPLPHLLHLILREKLTLPQLKKTNLVIYKQLHVRLSVQSLLFVRAFTTG